MILSRREAQEEKERTKNRECKANVRILQSPVEATDKTLLSLSLCSASLFTLSASLSALAHGGGHAPRRGARGRTEGEC